MIAGNVAIAGVGNSPGNSAKLIPNRLALAVLDSRSLDLEGTCSHAPNKSWREGQCNISRRMRCHWTAPVIQPKVGRITRLFWVTKNIYLSNFMVGR